MGDKVYYYLYEKCRIKSIDFNIILNYLLIAYAFFVPTFKYINKYIIIILFIVWIVEGNFRYKLKLIQSSKFIIVFLLFILYSYISLLWTSEFTSALHYVNKYWLYIPVLIIFTSVKKDFIKYLIFAFLVGMFISEIITYGIYFDYWSTSYNDKHLSSSPTAFMSHLSYSMFLAFTSLLVLSKFAFENKPIFNLGLILYFLLVFGNLIISGGRTGLLSFVVTLILFILFFTKHKIRTLFVGIVGASLLFYISYSTVPIFNAKIMDTQKSVVKIIKKEYNTSIGYRVALVQVGVEVFKEKPIFGWGIKDNFEAIKQITQKKEYSHLAFTYNVKNQHYHNQYIIYATQLGVLGLILFLLLFYYLNQTDAKSDELNKIKFILIVVTMTSVLSTELFHQMHPIALFSLFSGLILAHNRCT